MAYTDETLALAVYERLKLLDASVEASVIPRIRASIPQALEATAIKIGLSPDRRIRNLLRKSFTSVSLASDLADLAPLMTDTQPILLDAIRWADIRHADSDYKVQMLADWSTLDLERSDEFLYGAVEGTVLKIPGASNGALTITANYIEKSVANVKQQVEPFLFDELIGMVRPVKAEAA